MTNILGRNALTGLVCAVILAMAMVLVNEDAEAMSWGGCYDLEVIAQNTKTVSSSDNNGHRIFIAMNAKTNILLQEGAFGVIDYNGTDGQASFSLPNPDPTNSGTSVYSVFARLVGKPGSTVDITTCATDTLGNLYCSQQSMSMKRIAGTSKFLNVTADLLYIYADINGVITRVPLFSSTLQNYFWSVDSTGRLHAQLRFCPVSTTVP
jgi:hypothetical protein